MLQGRTAFWGASSDELQAAWNLWWVRKALVELHTSPYYTTWIHFPSGTTLLPHPLALPHGIFYTLLAPFLSLAETSSIIVLLGFSLSALLGYLLARELGCKPLAAFFAGYVLSFSNYHFLHLRGHLEFVSLEFLVLWFFLLIRFLKAPTHLLALSASISLFTLAVLNSYYFLAAALGALVIGACFTLQNGNLIQKYWSHYVTLCTASLLSSGLYVLHFLRSLAVDPLLRGHSTELGSLHPIETILPGRFWKFSTLTESAWSTLPGYEYEHSVGLGVGLFLLVALAAGAKLLRSSWELRAWAWIFLLSLWLSLGPLIPSGIDGISLPSLYSALDALFPFSRLSGVPARLFVLTTLAAALLAGAGMQVLLNHRRYIIAALLMCLAVVENFPQAIVMNTAPVPAWTTKLRETNLPTDYGLLDAVHRGPQQLYLQTIHEKPMAFGYTARTTKRVNKQNRIIRNLLGKGEASVLCTQYKFSHALLNEVQARRFVNLAPPIFQEDGIGLYKLCTRASEQVAR